MRKRTGLILAVLALGACATSEPERLPPPERKPVIQRMALDTELLFDFDSALLRQAYQRSLKSLEP